MQDFKLCLALMPRHAGLRNPVNSTRTRPYMLAVISLTSTKYTAAPRSLTGRSKIWLQNTNATNPVRPGKEASCCLCFKALPFSRQRQMSYRNRMSRATKIVYRCTPVLLQFYLHPRNISFNIPAAFWGSPLNTITFGLYILHSFVLSLFLLTLPWRHWLQWTGSVNHLHFWCSDIWHLKILSG